MAPIRVGIIGLSSVTNNISGSPGDSWAVTAHLPYLLKSPHYEITALCNSDVKSAEAAIKRHGLPSSTKAYGSPEDIANDPDVDLVVCSVRVDRHYKLMMPSLKAGKASFIEWPLASTLQQAEEMLAASKESGSKTIIGMQSRPSPYIQKVKELVQTKAIGDLISSTFNYVSGNPGGSLPPGAEYVAQKGVGGNFMTIHGGHMIDSVLYALGDELPEVSVLLPTRWPESKLTNPDGSIRETIKIETPDHIFLQGTLKKSRAPISFNLRRGQRFPSTTPLVWSILGTKGEIRVTASEPVSLALGDEQIEIYDYEKESVEEVAVDYDAEVQDLATFAKNIGKLYHLYATGGSKEQGFVDFEDAVRMHRILHAMEKSYEKQTWESI